MTKLIKVYIFNPDTDMALASNSPYYTPPANILLLKNKLALIPSLYAEPGSIILVDKKSISNLPYYNISTQKNIEVLTIDELNSNKYYEFIPWGWNNSLRQKLSNYGFKNIPDSITIESYRNLSHRRTTIKIHQSIAAQLTNYKIAEPKEFNNDDDALTYISKYDNVYLKMPWSSSGRGVYHPQNASIESIREWIRGCISRQDSVMIEVGLNRHLDFATEWECKNGETSFLGFSIFKTDHRGRYCGNIIDSNEGFLNRIAQHTDKWNDNIIDILKNTLDKIVAPHYNGPLGIDMLISDSGDINLCVELNLRMTMGHIALSLWQQTKKAGLFMPGCD